MVFFISNILRFFYVSIQRLEVNGCENTSFVQSETRTIVLHSVKKYKAVRTIDVPQTDQKFLHGATEKPFASHTICCLFFKSAELIYHAMCCYDKDNVNGPIENVISPLLHCNSKVLRKVEVK